MTERVRLSRAEQAESIYANREVRHNCAQAVLRAFQERFGLSESDIRKAACLGGGQAENGTCGAVWAAGTLAERHAEGMRDELEKRFLQHSESLRCRDIRRANVHACRDCVRMAADILDRMLQES